MKLIAISSGSSSEKLWKKAQNLLEHLKLWIKSEGIKNVSKHIKSLEHNFLLGNSSDWRSLRFFKGDGISHLGTKILLTIHKNMFCPPAFDKRSIQYQSCFDLSKFISNY